MSLTASIIGLACELAILLAPKPLPNLSITSAHGAWFDALAASLDLCFALASSIPMHMPQDTTSNPASIHQPAVDKSR